MASCDKCFRELKTVFERGGIWLCRECYVGEVLKKPTELDADRAEELADLLDDPYWEEENYIHFRRCEDE